jgi:hypothetical protein
VTGSILACVDSTGFKFFLSRILRGSDGDDVPPLGAGQAATGVASNRGEVDLATEVAVDNDSIPGALALAATGVAPDDDVPLLGAAALDGDGILLQGGATEVASDGDEVRVPMVATGMAFLEASPSRCLQTLK